MQNQENIDILHTKQTSTIKYSKIFSPLTRTTKHNYYKHQSISSWRTSKIKRILWHDPQWILMRPIDDSNILIIAEWKNRESYTNIREYETKNMNGLRTTCKTMATINRSSYRNIQYATLSNTTRCTRLDMRQNKTKYSWH